MGMASWLLTVPSEPPHPSLRVPGTMEGMAHPSSGGQGNPRKEKQRDGREDVMLCLQVSFPYFPVNNVRTSKGFVEIRPVQTSAKPSFL